MILLANALPFLQWMVNFIHWAKGMGPAGGALYAVVYILGTALFFPGLPLTLGAGFLYGAVIGTLVVSPASVAGATLAFLIARYVARDWVTRRLKKYPQAAAIDRAIEKNGFKAVVLLRLQPVLPFNILNYALGLTSIRLRGRPNSGMAGRLLLWGGLAAIVVLVWWLGRIARKALREEMGPDSTAVMKQ